MKDFHRTAINAEREIGILRDKKDMEFCTTEIYNSINALITSFEKFVENAQPGDVTLNKEHIDNVYYHVGKIKACL